MLFTKENVQKSNLSIELNIKACFLVNSYGRFIFTIQINTLFGHGTGNATSKFTNGIVQETRKKGKQINSLSLKKKSFDTH